ncbi:MAG TPA: hypothetical protein VN260_02245, partial [Dissulfurispiraceae bacterium]|nr:hypothetical protein [Dissulfurispiraceae bacterium]
MPRQYRMLAVVLLTVLAVTGFHEVVSASSSAGQAAGVAQPSTLPWWAWPLILFVVTFFLGIVAVLG